VQHGPCLGRCIAKVRSTSGFPLATGVRDYPKGRAAPIDDREGTQDSRIVEDSPGFRNVGPKIVY